MHEHLGRIRAGGARLALAALVVLLATAGGIVATIVAPMTVSTDYYTAKVTLSPSWQQRSSIGVETIVGGASARFSGLAPGVEVSPQVRPEISDVVSGGDVSTTKLVVSQAERERVISEATKGVALRFVVGSVLAALVPLVGYGLWRHRRPSSRAVGVAVLAWALTCAGSGLGAWQTYRAERFSALEATGLLRLAADNRTIFTDVETRAGQATPYLRNLLALSAALRSEYAPTATPEDDAVTVMLVSDIHSSNQYALMRTVVEEQGVDVVIDTGDLINLGRVEELRISRLAQGIESLGVPYVFVRGNHDASSATDTALLDELSRVENVYLPDPGDGRYHEVEVDGLRIAGFNDPRWYGDSDDGSTDTQAQARERWVQALGEGTPPDLLLSHEAPAVHGAPGRLQVHGHGHTPGVDGSRVAVGTFTGGGTLSHFHLNPEDAELVGQPSSFDLLTFGADCQARTLTRYQYRSVIEGRPSMDRISVLNAARVAEPAEEGRVCGQAAEPDASEGSSPDVQGTSLDGRVSVRPIGSQEPARSARTSDD